VATSGSATSSKKMMHNHVLELGDVKGSLLVQGIAEITTVDDKI
jgi:hypothetical protein